MKPGCKSGKRGNNSQECPRCSAVSILSTVGKGLGTGPERSPTHKSAPNFWLERGQYSIRAFKEPLPRVQAKIERREESCSTVYARMRTAVKRCPREPCQLFVFPLLRQLHTVTYPHTVLQPHRRADANNRRFGLPASASASASASAPAPPLCALLCASLQYIVFAVMKSSRR